MGGGGGGDYYGWRRIEHSQLQHLASAGTDQAQYEQDVAEILQDALKAFNERDTATIHKHLETIKKALSQQIEGTVELAFGGSISKYTYVNGLSDVDMLVGLNDTSLANKSPGEVLSHFADSLRKRLPNTEAKIGKLAVTVKFSDGHEIQLLPATKTATGFKIARPNENSWSNVVSPRRFAQKLTQVNQKLGGKVVPVIKLAKAMNEKLPKQSRLSGYHLESLAIEAFKNYDGRQTHQAMLQHFWKEAQSRVLNPIKDSTGQSRHVDDYLGSTNSVGRQRASNAIQKINAKMQTANNMKSADTWEEMLEP